MQAQGTQAVVNSQMLVSRITQPRSASRWLVPLLGLYALAWVFHGQGGLIKPDETWFLQIVRRILSGEVLYRDVEYGATPLALYVTVPFVALFGAQLLVIRSVYMVFFAGSVLLARKISQQLARSPGAGAGVVLALCVYAQPRSLLPLYNPLAYLFLLGCLTAALRWQQDGSGKALALAGLCAGLCFSSKQTVGAYALAALLVVVFLERLWRPDGCSKLAQPLRTVVAWFGVAVILSLLPVAFSGSGSEFLDQTIATKPAYVRFSGISYWQNLRLLAGTISSARTLALSNAGLIYWRSLFLLPPLTLLLLLATLWRDRAGQRGPTVTVLLFADAGLLGLFPLADDNHLFVAMPPILVGLAYAWRRLASGCHPAVRRLVQAGVLAWLSAGLLFLVLSPPIRLWLGTVRVSGLPHLRGVLIQTLQETEINRHTQALREVAAPGERLLLLTPYASLYYLTAELRNPTPFDYPLVHVFGPHGEEDLARAVARGGLSSVCLDTLYYTPPFFSRLRPARLEQAVREHLQPGPNLGFCTLYRTR